MTKTKRWIASFAAAFVLVSGFTLIRNGCKRAATDRLTRETENARVADNGIRSISQDIPKFLRAMGQDGKVKIVANTDGTFTVSVPSVNMTKAQLEKYAAENTTWIED